MAVNTYFFDGSDAAASDPNAVWNNETNLDDGSTATGTVPTATGSTSSNFIIIEGTDAPASGGTITQVQARMYTFGGGGASFSTAIYTDGLGELLGTNTSISDPAGYGGYTTLSTPTGGWTWAKVQALESKTYATNTSFSPNVYRIEIEVTHSGFGPTLATTAFRYYADGTETGSTALETQGTNTVQTVNDDYNFALRLRIQESGATAGATTDDYQLQYSKNGGSYTNVTSSSSNVKGYNSTSLTDAGTTTNRLGSGTGSFVAGEIAEDGLVDDRQITASNYTEMLYSLTAIASDLAKSDTLDFQVLFNGATITNTVVPRFSVTPPLYKSTPILGTVGAGGLNKNVIMFLDQ